MNLIPGFMVKRRRTSPTTLTWTKSTSTPNSSYPISYIACSGTTFAFNTQTGSSTYAIYSSSNPTGSWTGRQSTSKFGKGFYGNGVWVILENDKIYTATSVSGTWTQRDPDAGSSDKFNSIVYSTDLSLWIIGGENGVMYTASDPTSTWTSRTSGFGTTLIRALGAGNNLLVAVGTSGTLTTSSDGTTWTSRTSSFGTSNIESAAYGNSKWVFGGADDKLATSTDPTSSITQNANTSTWASTVEGLAYGDSLWCSVGTGGVVATASDPSSTWTANTSNTTNDLNCVIVGTNYWVVGGIYGTILTSPIS